jgi:pimeloyl-ACP methyl ester carboxylesterase
VSITTVAHPEWPRHDVTIYAPQAADEKRPVILFAHGYGGINHEYYEHILTNLAGNGYYCIYAPANPLRNIMTMYTMYDSGFAAGLSSLQGTIDTTRMGFMGHSFGAGYCPSAAYTYLVDKGWGANGAFVFSMAPWYSYRLSDTRLAGFPDNTYLLMQVYENDTINDHRMAVDIYEHMGIPDANKDYVIVYDDTLDGYHYEADHSVPTNDHVPNGETDALDYYGIQRLANALAAWAFYGDSSGRDVALGNGTPQQRFMGATQEGDSLHPLTSTDAPVALHPESFFLNTWSDARNPRHTSIVRDEQLSGTPSAPFSHLQSHRHITGTVISFRLHRPVATTIALFTPAGRHIHTFHTAARTGRHTRILDNVHPGTGTYIVTVRSAHTVWRSPLFIR